MEQWLEGPNTITIFRFRAIGQFNFFESFYLVLKMVPYSPPPTFFPGIIFITIFYLLFRSNKNYKIG